MLIPPCGHLRRIYCTVRQHLREHRTGEPTPHPATPSPPIRSQARHQSSQRPHLEAHLIQPRFWIISRYVPVRLSLSLSHHGAVRFMHHIQLPCARPGPVATSDARQASLSLTPHTINVTAHPINHDSAPIIPNPGQPQWDEAWHEQRCDTRRYETILTIIWQFRRRV